MKNKTILPIVLFYILVLSACTYTGRNDLGMYINRYNSVCDKDLEIEDKDIVLHTNEETSENTYYIFYPTESGGEYMITLNENAEGDIYQCGICIISGIDADPKIIENIFISEAYSLKNLSSSTAKKIFEDLKLDDKSTYEKTESTSVTTDEYTIDLIVNKAGTGIYIS